jgi:hypothetical protein
VTQLRSFGFDKSKLVASISVYAPFYAVFDMRTGALIQTFFNTSDGHDSFGEIHLAPNGKIVTDHAYVGTTMQLFPLANYFDVLENDTCHCLDHGIFF